VQRKQLPAVPDFLRRLFGFRNKNLLFAHSGLVRAKWAAFPLLFSGSSVLILFGFTAARAKYSRSEEVSAWRNCPRR
jgi:hypothetical protein